ncbi:DUF3488 and transglutaminase-like domain-containing protein [Microbulbifer sp. SAOS-129_SWC]|uniref:transglutaminase TgpA family protein n=1 Tax=Microbulbifer sp. SAOS-129_SWC TaxID=3145235 RepID=UPI0032178966
MSTAERLPRESLLWIFAAQLAALLPQFSRLPLWIPIAWALAVYWRFQVYRGRWDLPGRWIKLLAVVLALGGLLLSFRHWFSLAPMVALLAVSFTLKNLELFNRRDAFLSLLLSYFVAATLFVFEQSIPYAIYGCLCVVVITAGLAAQLGSHSAAPRRALGLSLRLLAQAVPLMLLLFVVLPRLGPLWAVPQSSGGASTGISDSMSPGDFTDLSRSDEPTLRIAFDGPVPPPEQRYWRGLVYEHFDGRRWSLANHRYSGGPHWQLPPARPLPEVGPRYRYRVIQEPTNSRWLFAMARPNSNTEGVEEMPDDRLLRRAPVYSRFAYEVRSWPRESLAAGPPLSLRARRRNLQLPDGVNPRTRAWVRNLRRRGLDAQQMSAALLDFFHRDFTYTLKPPALGADSVDDFLFDTRQGFCEHFAGAYVFAMRAAGVPARVVAGYQGGEWVAQEKYLLVRQYDAHAWAEIWTPARGWQRVDPTAAVSPERIRDGLESAAADEFMQDSLLPLHRISILNRLRLQWDMINYRWYSTVISFDSDKQQSLLQRLLGEVSALRMALLLAVPAALALLGILAWMWFSGRGARAPRSSRLYRKFCRRLARAGLQRRSGEAPRDFCRRVCVERPQLAPAVRAITAAFERAAYGGDAAAEKQLRLLLRRFWPLRAAAAR